VRIFFSIVGRGRENSRGPEGRPPDAVVVEVEGLEVRKEENCWRAPTEQVLYAW